MVQRVVHFTTVHPATDVRIFTKECATLAAAGYDVTLVAPDPPTEVRQGVRFVAVPASTGGRLRRAITGNVRLARLLFGLRADVYHFHDPELLPLGLLLRVARRRVVYDVHEDVVRDVRTKPYLSPFVARALATVVAALHHTMCLVASHVVVATPTLAGLTRGRRVRLVRNFPIIDAEAVLPDLEDYRTRAEAGAYVGAITERRMAAEMFAAAAAVAATNPRFHVITAGPTYGVADPAGLPGIDYRGVLPRDRVAGILDEARFGLSLVADEEHLADALPTKVFEYCAAGLPVVISRSNRAILGLVEGARCGLVVDGGDAEAIASAMRTLIDDPTVAHEMGQRGAVTVRSEYSWAPEGEALLDVYRGLQ